MLHEPAIYNCSNASIAKTLLLQMPKVTFTQFHNELARVLGTHQCPKASSKAVSISTVESESGDEAAPSKAQQKCKAKVSAQSSQIQDLHSKLDAAIMENSQIREFLNLGMLQTVVTNALQAVQSRGHGQSNNGRQSKPFLGKPQEPQLSAGKDGSIDPEKMCQYCKDTWT